MKTGGDARQMVLMKIQKRLYKVIRTYEKVITKMEIQLKKVDQLTEDEAVTTLRKTITSGLDQSRKFLEKAQEDYRKIIAQQADL